MISSALFSDDRRHRYLLSRWWGIESKMVMFVGLNPSTADEVKNDQTVTRCINYAKQWGYGGLIMTNIFAFRATDPARMKAAPDPVGPENDHNLLFAAEKAQLIVCAWGNHGEFLGRGKQVAEMLKDIKELHCLATNKTGHPKHPLYLNKNLVPVKFSPTSL